MHADVHTSSHIKPLISYTPFHKHHVPTSYFSLGIASAIQIRWIIRIIIPLNVEKVSQNSRRVDAEDSESAIRLKNINFKIDFILSVSALHSFQTLPKTTTH